MRHRCSSTSVLHVYDRLWAISTACCLFHVSRRFAQFCHLAMPSAASCVLLAARAIEHVIPDSSPDELITWCHFNAFSAPAPFSREQTQREKPIASFLYWQLILFARDLFHRCQRVISGFNKNPKFMFCLLKNLHRIACFHYGAESMWCAAICWTLSKWQRQWNAECCSFSLQPLAWCAQEFGPCCD